MPNRLWHPTFPGVHVDVSPDQVAAHKRAGWRTTPAGTTPAPAAKQPARRKTRSRARGTGQAGDAG